MRKRSKKSVEPFDPEKVSEVLQRCWSVKTSRKWTERNPGLGQCSVSALVVQDWFGGKILKTKVGDAWHFYNEINHQAYDLTASQFGDERVVYEDESRVKPAPVNCTGK